MVEYYQQMIWVQVVEKKCKNNIGKTIQALAIANYYKSEWPLLIVCPSSLRNTWKEVNNSLNKTKQSICEWLYETIAPCDINVIYNTKDFELRMKITIVSYDQLPKYVGLNNGINYNVIISVIKLKKIK